ncbi:hypothetical protein F5Y18DRAFT_245461 [Xylariaceae sp. FL1019]|nr:hypothetical protein F5Y18DRAFT_245461 [Xylariaceae sp. FL1019]
MQLPYLLLAFTTLASVIATDPQPVSFLDGCYKVASAIQAGEFWLTFLCSDGSGASQYSALDPSLCIANSSGQLVEREMGYFDRSCDHIKLSLDGTQVTASCSPGGKAKPKDASIYLNVALNVSSAGVPFCGGQSACWTKDKGDCETMPLNDLYNWKTIPKDHT